MDAYKTLKSFGCDEYVVKKSRFIGYAAPVAGDGAAVDFINEIRQKHRDAAHNVYAYSVREGQLKRYSDDGEPQGTAGVPVLNVILNEEICDCAVVVTRYFGGTLLGTGGLVRAYSRAAKLALEKAGAGEMLLWSVLTLKCDYNFYGKLSSIMSENAAVTLDAVFETEVFIKLKVPSEYEKNLQKAVTESSGGRLTFERLYSEYGFM